MTQSLPTMPQKKEGRQIVPRPRVTDAIGHALRGAFDGSYAMPDDFDQLLRRLDVKTARPH